MDRDLTQPSRPFDPPDIIEPGSGSMPEVPEMFAPGEMVQAEGLREPEFGWRNERLPERYQTILKTLIEKNVAERDLFARIDELLRAAEQRFYWRSMFDIYFNEQNYVWEYPGMLPWKTGDSGNVRLSYAFNIYQAEGRGFISQVGQVPNVRFDAVNVGSADALRISTSANAYKRKIESINDIGQIAKEVSRLFYTDGRVCLYSRWVTDGARFGYEDDADNQRYEASEGLGHGGTPPPKQPRRPKGGEKIDAFGVLEVRTPITMRKLEDFPFLQLSYEIDLSTAKAMYPHISQYIGGQAPGPGEYEFDQVTRVAINQGLRLLTQTGDTVHQIPTWQRTWLRPSTFAEIENNDDRLFFERNFPDGCLVAFIGDTYAESRNESMDDHWVVMYPIEGDAQQTPSAGYVMMAVQDAICDLTDYFMEAAMKAIPAIICNKGMIDLQALSKQKAGPGAHWPTMRELAPEEDISKSFWPEPTPEIDPAITTFYQQLWDGIPEKLTGLTAPLLGSADPSNQTKGGILALADASRGFQGPCWRSWQSGYSKSLEKLVRIGSYFRQAEAQNGRIEISVPGEKNIEVELDDLRPGTCYAIPDSDQNLPQTFEDQQRNFAQLWAAAIEGFAPANQILMEPRNRILAKKFIAIPGLEIPGANSAEKQMAEIEEMLLESPIPNVGAMQLYGALKLQALATGAPAPPEPPPQAMYSSSIPISEEDDNSTEAETCVHWMRSPRGQQTKRENPQGYMNVKLHWMAHQQAAQGDMMQKAQQMALLQAAPKILENKAKASQESDKPSESINFKDLPPSGKLQMALQAGIQVQPGELAEQQAQEHAQNMAKIASMNKPNAPPSN